MDSKIKKVGSITAIILLIMLVVSLVGWGETLKKGGNVAAQCNQGNPSAITAILIDHTDSIGPISRVDLETKILNGVIEKTKAGEWIELYSVQPITDAPLAPKGEGVCNPGSALEKGTLGSLTSNPRLDEVRLLDFNTRVNKTLTSLLDQESANVSPIMESVQSLSVTVFGRQKKSIQKRLVIVSDLLQNSPTAWSVYTSGIKFDTFSETPGAANVASDMRDIKVEILFLQRYLDKPINQGDLVRFWDRWINSQGGDLTRITKIAGVN